MTNLVLLVKKAPRKELVYYINVIHIYPCTITTSNYKILHRKLICESDFAVTIIQKITTQYLENFGYESENACHY